MKKHSIILVSLLILGFLSTININLDISIKNPVSTKNYNTLKNASYWNLYKTIHISFDNWSNIDFPWVQNRSGTWDDPHIIENVTIDSLGNGNGILIENCYEFFIIRNCTIYNSGTNAVTQNNYAGVRLRQTSNGTLIDNQCYDNQVGILLHTSNNITIEHNICRNNVRGILLYSSNENHLKRNTVYSNTGVGIFLYTQCQNNEIIGNKVYDNLYGIELVPNCDHNLISNNLCYLNRWGGIMLFSGSNDNDVIHNIVNNNLDRGIEMNLNANNNFLFNNTLTGNDQSGILVITSDSNTIWKNNLIDNAGDYNPISSPWAYSGVCIRSSNLNNFSENSISGSYVGVYLEQSNNSNIQKNTIRRFTYCINETDCNGNIISDNNCLKSTPPSTPPLISGYPIPILFTLCILMTFLIIRFKMVSTKKNL